MKHENRIENTSRKQSDMPGMRHPRWDRRVTRSLGDDERVVPKERMGYDDESEWSRKFRKIVNIMCEWSLMTSLIRRFGVPYE